MYWSAFKKFNILLKITKGYDFLDATAYGGGEEDISYSNVRHFGIFDFHRAQINYYYFKTIQHQKTSAHSKEREIWRNIKTTVLLHSYIISQQSSQ